MKKAVIMLGIIIAVLLGALVFVPAKKSTAPSLPQPVPIVKNLPACEPTGCNKEVCSDEEVMTPCIYSTEYACYKTARCERQASGECGWTQMPELESCLGKARR